MLKLAKAQVDYDMRGYRALWASVIFSALIDAQKVPEANTGETLLSIYESREYITSYSAGLKEVCEMAGIHYDDVLKQGRMLKAKGWFPKSRHEWAIMVGRRISAQKRYLHTQKQIKRFNIKKKGREMLKKLCAEEKTEYFRLKDLCKSMAMNMEPSFLNLKIAEDK